MLPIRWVYYVVTFVRDLSNKKIKAPLIHVEFVPVGRGWGGVTRDKWFTALRSGQLSWDEFEVQAAITTRANIWVGDRTVDVLQTAGPVKGKKIANDMVSKKKKNITTQYHAGSLPIPSVQNHFHRKIILRPRGPTRFWCPIGENEARTYYATYLSTTRKCLHLDPFKFHFSDIWLYL